MGLFGERLRFTTYLASVVLILAFTTIASAYGPSAAITIAATGAASPYPATVTVSGATGTISSMTVRLNSFTHTVPDDVDILLVGPTGIKVILMSDAGGYTAPAGAPVTLTFQEGSPALPDETQITGGTYSPTNYGKTPDPFCAAEPDPDTFPAAAPAGPYSGTLSAFAGTDPNGTWSLYVFDDCATGSGSIAGGFEVFFTTTPTTVTLQGFSATRTDRGVLVRWKTTQERDVLGFHVYRATPNTGYRARLTKRLIGARGGATGARYSFVDRSARRGVTYRYLLQEVALDGTLSWRGAVAVRR